MARAGKQKRTNSQAEAKPVQKGSPAADPEKSKAKKKSSASAHTAEQPKKSDAPKTTPASKESGQNTQEKKNVQPQKPQTKRAPAPKADHKTSNDQNKANRSNQGNGTKEAKLEAKLARNEQSKRTVFLWRLVPEVSVADLQKTFPNAEDIKVMNGPNACNIRFPSLEEAQAVANQKEIKVNGRTFPVKMLVTSEGGQTVERWRRIVSLSPVSGDVELDQVQNKFPNATSITSHFKKNGYTVVFPTVAEMMEVAKMGEIEIGGHKVTVKYHTEKKEKRPNSSSSQPSKYEPKAKRVKTNPKAEE